MLNKIYKFKNKKDLTKLIINDCRSFLSFILQKIKKFLDFQKVVFFIDENLKYKEEYKDFLKSYEDEKNEKDTTILYLKINEKEKNFFKLENIFSIFLENNIDKKTLIIIIGGGAFSDTISFASSIYKRGISFSLVPTTFLSMIDASFGGKNGVNLMGVKNLLGTVNQPLAIFINPYFIKTLSYVDFLSGFAEFIKYLLLNNKLYKRFTGEFSKFLNSSKLLTSKFTYDTFPCNLLKEFFIQNPKFFLYAIDIKYKFIKDDIYDFNKRHILNLGHTVSHPLEIVFELNHGIALYIGIILELQIISKICKNAEHAIKKAYNLYDNFKLPIDIKQALKIEKNITYDKWLLEKRLDGKKVIEKIFDLIRQDKKNFQQYYNLPVILNSNKIILKKIPFETFDYQFNSVLNEMLS